MNQAIDNSQWPLNTLLVSHTHRVINTPIAKNANTTLKRVFVPLSGHPRSAEILDGSDHANLTARATGLSLCDYSRELAGSVYLVQIFAGSFQFYIRAKLFEPDGAATAANVVASETLYRLGMLSEVLVGLTWLSIALILFVLLNPVRKELSRLFLILTIVGVGRR